MWQIRCYTKLHGWARGRILRGLNKKIMLFDSYDSAKQHIRNNSGNGFYGSNCFPEQRNKKKNI